MKISIILLLIVFSIISNAQNINSDMRNENEICGGYRSKNTKTQPLKDIKGEVVKLYCTYYNRESTQSFIKYDMQLDSLSLKGSISPEGEYEKFQFNIENTAKNIQTLSKALKESGLLDFNKWSVYVNGLPPIVEFYISATFSTGEQLYIEFNGGHSPDGFDKAADKFSEAFLNIVEYSPDKCKALKPYVNPFLGEHHFVYSKNGKEQFFNFIIENNTGKDNAEVISKGDFGEFHARCNATNVTGRYHVSILRYYDDSNVKTAKEGSLAGIIFNNNGNLWLEPLQAAPDLPDRNRILEIK